MKFLRNFVDKAANQIKKSISKYTITVLFLLLYSLYLSFLVIVDVYSGNHLYIAISFPIAILTSLLLYLLFKNDSYLKILIPSVLSSILVFVLFNIFKDNMYLSLGYVGILLIEIVLIVFFLIKNNKEEYFAYIVCNAFYCLCLCTTIMIGVSIVIYAFDSLIFSFNNIYKAYYIAAIFIYILICLTLFISYLSSDSIVVPKYFHNIINVAGIFVYYLLIVVLYVYIFKIIITRSMPVGRLNWLGSFALIFNAFFYLSSSYEETGIAKIHNKYGGYILLPVFIIQTVAIYIRINAYGLTTLRYVSILLNVIGLSFIIAQIIKRKLWTFILIDVIVLIACIGPLNIFDVPVYSQQSILKNVLIKNNMFDDYRIIPNSNISIEDKETIISAYDYLHYDNSNKIKFDFENKPFNEIFGFDKFGSNSYIYCSYNSSDFKFDVSGYKSVYVIEGYAEDGIINGVNVKELALDLYKKHGQYGVIISNERTINENSDVHEMYAPEIVIDSNSKIVFDTLYFEVIGDDVDYIGYHAYVLEK